MSISYGYSVRSKTSDELLKGIKEKVAWSASMIEGKATHKAMLEAKIEEIKNAIKGRVRGEYGGDPERHQGEWSVRAMWQPAGPNMALRCFEAQRSPPVEKS
eukprot:428114-Prorocentrum_minimum.AAC.1